MSFAAPLGVGLESRGEYVDTYKCIGCKACMAIGCPAISQRDGKAVIDRTQCVGCGVCEGLCPKQAIVSKEAKA